MLVLLFMYRSSSWAEVFSERGEKDIMHPYTNFRIIHIILLLLGSSQQKLRAEVSLFTNKL